MRIAILKTMILPSLTYAIEIWYGATKAAKKPIFTLYKRALRTLVNYWCTSTKIIRRQFGLWDLDNYYSYINKNTFKMLYNREPYIMTFLKNKDKTSGISFDLPNYKRKSYHKCILYRRLKNFNDLPLKLRNTQININQFNQKLKRIIE